MNISPWFVYKRAKNKPRRNPAILIGVSVSDGAISSHFQALANNLSLKGHTTAILSPKGAGQVSSIGEGFSLMEWPSLRPTAVKDALFLTRIIRETQPACLISHFSTVNWMCVLGKILRVPIRMAWYHTLSSQIDVDCTTSRIRSRYQRSRKKWVYKTATHLIANSECGRRDLAATFGIDLKKVHIWRNSIKDPSDQLSFDHHIDSDSKLICAARFSPSKGQEVLLLALSLMRSRGLRPSVEFLGDGEMMGKMVEYSIELGLGDQCIFAGRVPHKDVLRRFSKARAVVVPSLSEAFGLVNIEAMGVGVPVVASNTGGNAEIVRHGLDGFLFQPGNAHELSIYLEKICTDQTLATNMGHSARVRFLERFEQSEVVRVQSDWLEGLLNDLSNTR